MVNPNNGFKIDAGKIKKSLKENKTTGVKLLKELASLVRELAKEKFQPDINFLEQLYDEIDPIRGKLNTRWKYEDDYVPGQNAKGRYISDQLRSFEKGESPGQAGPYLAWICREISENKVNLEPHEYEEEFIEKFRGKVQSFYKKIGRLKPREYKFPSKTDRPSEAESPSSSSDLDATSSEKTGDTESPIHDDLLNKIPPEFNKAYSDFFLEYQGDKNNPRAFGGRSEEIKKLNKWLNNPEASGKLLLTTPAGMGKSALLFNWTQQISKDESNDWEVVFIPISIRFGSSQKETFFPALAKKLAALYQKEFSSTVNGTINAVYCQHSVEEWLANPLPDGRKLLIVIDGMDEVTGGKLVGGFLARQASGVKVVVAARLLATDEGKEGWMERLHWDSIRNSVNTMDLGPLSCDGIRDVIKQMVIKDAYQNKWEERDGILDRLTELTEGDPLLVRFYVEDLWSNRDCRRPKLEVSDLKDSKKGYEGYFKKWWKDQIDFWALNKSSPFEDQGRVCLAILACAKGPLRTQDIEDILQYVNYKSFDVRDFVSQFSRFIIGQGVETGFVFSHPKLNEFFETSDIIGIRIVKKVKDAFLTWGKDILVWLEDGSLEPENPDELGYLLRFYSDHLGDSGKKVQLKDAMALVSNGWRKAWYAYEGGYAGFAGNVQFAWSRAEQLDKNNKTELVPNFGDQVCCVLCLSSIATLGTNIPANILVLSLDTKVLKPEQVLNLIDQKTSEVDRAKTLALVAPYLIEPNIIEALKIARKILDEKYRTEALAALSPQLKESQRKEVISEILKAVRNISDKLFRGKTLTVLVPHLEESHREEVVAEVLELARDIWDEECRAKILIALIPCLKESHREKVVGKALELASEILDEEYRAKALNALIPCLGESHREKVIAEALAIASGIKFKDTKAKALTTLIPCLDETHREKVVAEALAAVSGIKFRATEAKALTALIPYLDETHREKVVAEALGLARDIWGKECRVKALTALIPYLDETHREKVVAEALGLARDIWDKECRVKALAALIPYLDETHRKEIVIEVLATTRKIANNEENQAKALTALIPYLDETHREKVVAKTLRLARDIRDEECRGKALTALIPCLDGTHREKVVAEVLVTIRKIADEEFRAKAITALIPCLEDPKRKEMITETLMAVREMSDKECRAEILTALIPCLEEFHRKEIVTEILATTRKIADEDFRAIALTTLIPCLEESHREKEVAEALELARDIFDEECRTEILTALIPYLEEFHREKVITEVLVTIRENEDEDFRAKALTTLISSLDESHREKEVAEALAATRGILDEEYRAKTLIALAPNLKNKEFSFTIKEILISCSSMERDKALTLIPDLSSLILLRCSTNQANKVARGILDVTSWWP